MIPAISGDERLVPPMRYSSYATPVENACVWPISMPVFGSPTAEMSGTTRPAVPHRVARDAGTTFCWYHGSAKMRLVPPPEPYRYVSVEHQALPVAFRNP